MQRVFLFLQGVASPFFPRLADRLSARGHRVLRVNFCAGDALLWGRRPALHYRGSHDRLPDYYQRLFREQAITDLVLFGDERPVHRPAIARARSQGIEIHVFEEGYLRPDWFTLERGGVNANSALPSGPDWYLGAGAGMKPEPSRHAPGGLKHRAGYDMAYHLANLANPLLYPGYRTHRPYSALTEYLGWARRFAPLPWHRRRDTRLIERLIRDGQPYYLLPLQLNADTQITRHSPYRDMREVLEVTLTSFARHAPAGTRLVIKNHPLDTGLQHYPRIIHGLSQHLGLGDRVQYLETGHLPTLLDHAAGVVVVNSTVGTSSLHHRRPTIALGEAIYGLPGLTYQGDLDSFWTSAEVPDPKLLGAFTKVVRALTQINGNLYTPGGIAMGLDACVARMEGPVPLPAPAVTVPAPAEAVTAAPPASSLTAPT